MRSFAIGCALVLITPAWGCGRVQYAPRDATLDSGIDAGTDAAVPETDASRTVDASDSAARLDTGTDASRVGRDAAGSADAPSDTSADVAIVPDASREDAPPPVDAGRDVAPDAAPASDAGMVLPRRVLGTTGVSIRGMGVLSDGTAVIAGLVDGAFTVGATAGASVGHRGLIAVGERLVDTFTVTDSGFYTDGPAVTVEGDLVIVTGYSRDPVTSACGTLRPVDAGDGYVITYRASDGACLWQRHTAAVGYETTSRTTRWIGGSAIMVATTGTGGGAFGAAFPAGAVVALRESDGSTRATFASSFAPSGVAVDGDTLYIVGEGTVEARDLRTPGAAPLWTRTPTAPGAMSVQLRDVAVVGTTLLVSGAVGYADPAPPGVGGWDDAWTVALGTDGSDRWDRLVGGSNYDYAWHVAAADGVVAGGLSVTGDMTVGPTSPGPPGYQALYVERDLATGSILRFLRLPEFAVTGVVPRPGRAPLFATTVAVYEWP